MAVPRMGTETRFRARAISPFTYIPLVKCLRIFLQVDKQDPFSPGLSKLPLQRWSEY